MNNQDWKKPLIDSIIRLRGGDGEQFKLLGGICLSEDSFEGTTKTIFTARMDCGSNVKIDGDLIFSQEYKSRVSELYRKNPYARIAKSIFEILEHGDKRDLEYIKNELMERINEDTRK